MKFTIRDIALVTMIVALALGWWVDRRMMNSSAEELRGELFRTRFRLIPLEAFTQGTDRIWDIKAAAEKSPPPPEAAVEILHYVRYERDYRIRIRAMDVLPHLTERDEAIEVLREALRDQDVERCAEGVVPLYAASYLAKMNAPKAKEMIQAWRETLTHDSPYDQESTVLLIKKVDESLAKLAAPIPETVPSSANPPQH